MVRIIKESSNKYNYLYTYVGPSPEDDYEQELFDRTGQKCRIIKNNGNGNYEVEFEDGSEYDVVDDELELSESITESPISGSGNLLGYNSEARDLLARVRLGIERKAKAADIYQDIIRNLREDNTHNVDHWARKGQNLSTIIKVYKQCIEEFKRAYPSNQSMITRLEKELAVFINIMNTTVSTKSEI